MSLGAKGLIWLTRVSHILGAMVTSLVTSGLPCLRQRLIDIAPSVQIRAYGEGTVQYRECNTTSTTDGSTMIYKIKAWFILEIKKLQLKEAVEQRVNIVAVCNVTSRG
jgi:hypothetical protein